MNRILEVYKAVHEDPFAKRFFHQNPVDGGDPPMGIPEAIGELARLYIENAMSQSAIPNVLLSRVLLGHNDESFSSSYDPASLIVGYGDANLANSTLRAILSYIKVSEALASDYPNLTQLVRHVYQRETANHWLWILSSCRRPQVLPSIITWQIDTDCPAEVVTQAHAILDGVAQNLAAIQFAGQGAMKTNEAQLHEQLNAAEVTNAIQDLITTNAAALKQWNKREILMLGFLRLLTQGDYAFVAIPSLFSKRIPYYSWAGLWAVIDLAGNDIESKEFADKLHALNLIAQELLAEIQGYTDRLKMWQRQMLADHRDIYESFLAYEFLPRSLGKIDLVKIPPPIECPGCAKSITLREFFPQVPFHEPDNKLVLSRLEEVLNIHRSSVSSREKRVIQSVLHDLQPGKIATVSTLPPDKFTREFESLRQRLRWIAPDVIHRDDANMATTAAARKALLVGIKEQVKPLLDVREYLRRPLAQSLYEKGVQSRTSGAKLLYYKEFDYDLSQRTDFLDWTWSDLCKRYADRKGIENLPFPIHYLDRTFDALIHNFEKYAAPGETCALRAVEDANSFSLQWSVSGGPAPFKDFEEFGKKVVEPLLSSDPKGINRGLPLSLTFGFETGAKRIDVWLKDNSEAGAWHPIFGKGDDYERLDVATFAIRWQWNLNGGNTRA
ncbi:MAG: hypothetical protein L0Z50_42650 [Verrucomicrobiales bacterium]|nr:hypothetical protein [Verrucomicrobiales bacterium]